MDKVKEKILTKELNQLKMVMMRIKLIKIGDHLQQ